MSKSVGTSLLLDRAPAIHSSDCCCWFFLGLFFWYHEVLCRMGVLWRELSFFYAVLHGTDDEVSARMPVEISIRQCYCVLICGHMAPIPLVQRCTRPGLISAGAMWGGDSPLVYPHVYPWGCLVGVCSAYNLAPSLMQVTSVSTGLNSQVSLCRLGVERWFLSST